GGGPSGAGAGLGGWLRQSDQPPGPGGACPLLVGGGLGVLPLGGGSTSRAGPIGGGVPSHTWATSRVCDGRSSSSQISLPSVRAALRGPSDSGLPSGAHHLVDCLMVYSSTRESSPTPTRTAVTPLDVSTRMNVPETNLLFKAGCTGSLAPWGLRICAAATPVSNAPNAKPAIAYLMVPPSGDRRQATGDG